MELNNASLDLPRVIVCKLKEKGYNYFSDIDSNIVEQKLGIKLNPSYLKMTPPTKTALEICSEELLNDCILSYNKNFDLVLNNVILPKTITELAGGSGSGKTQVCFQLCISVQLPKWCGGLEGNAIYIDTNSNFASHRILELANKFVKKYNNLKPSAQVSYTKFDSTNILQHIYYTKVGNILELLGCIKYLEGYVPGKNVRLLVIDSFSFILRMVDVKERITIINNIICDLRNLSRTHNFAVVITNDLTTRVNKGESYVTPSFGDSFYHLVNTRIRLSRDKDSFHVKLEKNSTHGLKETTFYL